MSVFMNKSCIFCKCLAHLLEKSVFEVQDHEKLYILLQILSRSDEK